MERGKKFAVISLGLMFALGFVAGLAMGPFMTPTEGRTAPPQRTHQRRPSMTETLSTQLNLDEEQKQQLSEITEQTRERFSELRKEVSPRFKAIRTETHDRIRAILRPEQLETFERLVAEWDEKEQQRRKEMESRWKRPEQKAEGAPAQAEPAPAPTQGGGP
ncbi:MAG: hypothetical protein FJ278_21490 [Planctomycetes bacterium]|nr:hypothetical protein [Planctomycetota bacterium]